MNNHPKRLIWGWSAVAFLFFLACTAIGIALVNARTSRAAQIAEVAINDCAHRRAAVQRDQFVANKLGTIVHKVASAEDNRVLTEIFTRAVPECPMGATRTRSKAATLAAFAKRAGDDLQNQHLADCDALHEVIGRVQLTYAKQAASEYQALKQKEAKARQFIADNTGSEGSAALQTSADHAKKLLQEVHVVQGAVQPPQRTYGIVDTTTKVGLMRPHLDQVDYLASRCQDLIAAQKDLDSKLHAAESSALNQ